MSTDPRLETPRSPAAASDEGPTPEPAAPTPEPAASTSEPVEARAADVTAPVGRGPRPIERRRWPWPLRWLAWLIVVLIALTGLAWLLLPTIAEHYLRESLPKIAEKLGREVDFDRLEVESLTHYELRGLRVLSLDAQAPPLLEVEVIAVRLTDNPLWGDDPRVASIEVRSPRVRLRREADGSTNVDDLIERLRERLARRDEAPDGPAKAPSRLARYFKPMPPIRVLDGAVEVSDASGALPVRVDGVEGLALTIQRDPETRAWQVAGELTTRYAVGDDPARRQTAQLDVEVWGRERGAVRLDFIDGLSVPFVEQALGRAVSLEGVSLTLPATLQVDGLQVAGAPDAQAPLLRVDALEVRLRSLTPSSLEALLVRDLTLRGVTLTTGIEEGGQLEVVQLIEGLQARRQRPPLDPNLTAARDALRRGALAGAFSTPPKRKAWWRQLQRATIEDLTVRVEDRRPDHLYALTLRSPILSYGYRFFQRRADFDLALEIGERGRLRALGTYWLDDRHLAARLSLDTVAFAPLEPALRALGLVAEGHADAALTPGMLLEELAVSTPQPGGDRPEDVLYLELDWWKRRDTLAVRGALDVEDIGLTHPKLSAYPLDGLDLGLAFEARYDGERDALEVSRLSVMADAGGRGELTLRVAPVWLLSPPPAGQPWIAPDAQVNLTLDVPAQPAQQVFESIPYGLRATLDGLRLDGLFGFQLTADGALDAVDEASVEASVTLEGFDVVQWPEGADLRGLNDGMRGLRILDPHATREHHIDVPPSTHLIEPLGRRALARSGLARAGGHTPAFTVEEQRAAYPHWVPFVDLSPWLIQMITTTEDGSFFRHAGFTQSQILGALQRNLEEGDFVRGASTISMQLVKNAFLGRDKTVARKLQEWLLTWLMESILRVPKERILEVYFNIIEFGPELYGVDAATRHYFGKRAVDLSLREVAFLLANLPRPQRAQEQWLKGSLDASMSRRINRYIDVMYRRKCDPEALARLARRGQPLPFERRCPPEDELERIKQDPLLFYKPEPGDPPYRPDLYDAHGQRLRPLTLPQPFGLPLDALDVDDPAPPDAPPDAPLDP